MLAETLTLLRQHLHADDLAGVDDAILTAYYQSARAYVVRLTQRTEDELTEMATVISTSGLPAELEQAVFMVTAHWYNQRETAAGTQMREVPHGAMALIRPFRRLSKV